ncbi:hypothetical protein VTI28DRAFT_7557 [Corynascus sepedonium]
MSGCRCLFALLDPRHRNPPCLLGPRKLLSDSTVAILGEDKRRRGLVSSKDWHAPTKSTTPTASNTTVTSNQKQTSRPCAICVVVYGTAELCPQSLAPPPPSPRLHYPGVEARKKTRHTKR